MQNASCYQLIKVKYDNKYFTLDSKNNRRDDLFNMGISILS
jgi:hypothetical protein